MADPITATIAAIVSIVSDAGAAVAAGAEAVGSAVGIGGAAAGAGAVDAAALGFPVAAESGIAFSAGTAATIGGINAGLIAVPAAAAGAGLAAAAGGAAKGGSLLTAADLVSLGASGLSAAGQVRAASGQAQALEFNQTALNEQATQELAAGAANARQVEQDNERRYGAAAAAMAASGIDPSQGTPLDIMSDLTHQGELSRRLTLWNAAQQAQQTRSRAALSGLQAGQTKTAGSIGAGTTLLTSLGRTVANQPDSPLSVPVVRF